MAQASVARGGGKSEIGQWRPQAGAGGGADPDRPGLRQGLGDEARRSAIWGWTTDTVSTGSLGLDIALGIGGLPRGRVIEIYGPECSGKTTLALHVVAEAQKKGGIAAYVDAEHALDPGLCQEAGRRYRRAADLPARHRRTGAGDHRHAGALGRRRHRGDRFGGGADAQGRARRRDGRSACPACRPG